jgi:hypothetical protein
LREKLGIPASIFVSVFALSFTLQPPWNPGWTGVVDSIFTSWDGEKYSQRMEKQDNGQSSMTYLS